MQTGAVKTEVAIASLDQIKEAVREVLREKEFAAAAAPPATPVVRYLTTAQVADLLQTSTRNVRHLSAAGDLPHLKVGTEYRFERAAVIAYSANKARGKK